jgi:hypothetical protein
VLMTNHFHLVIRTPEPNLSRAMQWLNGTYADWFNRRHKRAGHLFQGRFHAFVVEKEAYLAELLHERDLPRHRGMDHAHAKGGRGEAALDRSSAGAARRRHTVVQAIATIARLPRDVVRSAHGGRWRRLIAWIGWHEGLTTLRSIAAALRLRSEGHVSGLILRCDRDFGHDTALLASLDTAVALLRA